MAIPSQKQLIKEAQKMNDPYLTFWQKVELLRRYYELMEDPSDCIPFELIEEEYRNKKNVSKKNRVQTSSKIGTR